MATVLTDSTAGATSLPWVSSTCTRRGLALMALTSLSLAFAIGGSPYDVVVLQARTECAANHGC